MPEGVGRVERKKLHDALTAFVRRYGARAALELLEEVSHEIADALNERS